MGRYKRFKCWDSADPSYLSPRCDEQFCTLCLTNSHCFLLEAIMAQETETLLFPVALACITEASFFECGGIHKLYTMFVNLESLSKSSFTFGEVAEGKTDLVDSYFMLLSTLALLLQ